MALKRCKLPSGASGYKWGDNGIPRAERIDAERDGNRVFLAMDKASVRTVDVDGRLHVEITNISKAAVNDYLGSEIPDGEALGLDPNKIYKLYRDPAELEKAASTFNNLPVLSKHIPVNIDAPASEFIIGSTGTDGSFIKPFLQNSLVIWVRDAIEKILSKEKYEISSAYRYRAIMEPGVFENVAFDGRMVDIIGNHVAIVVDGRAGPDVVVADSLLPELIHMKRKLSRQALAVRVGLSTLIRPLLAQDAAMPDLTPALTKVTAKNFKSQKADIVKSITALVKPKLAADADLGAIVGLLDALEGDEAMTDEPEEVPAMDSPIAQILAMCKGKLDDEEYAKLEALVNGLEKPAVDANPDAPEKPEDGAPKPEVTKAAMDSAIEKTRKDTVAAMNAIKTAEREVRPLVGEITVAMDSAEAVYKFALEQKKQDLTDVHPSAYRSLVKMLNTAPITPVRLGMDADSNADFAKRFPETTRLTRSY